ncbi:MAG: hypothetical protein IT244_05315 [Bacteroidia bacterium]|nr:hypothetical protein [Bacteroidia bacterium]
MKILAIGLIVFVFLTILARVVSEKGLKFLNAEQKEGLNTAMAATRKWTVLALGAIIISFLLIIYNFRVEPMTGLFWYFGAFMGYNIFVGLLQNIKMRNLNLPQEFLKRNLFSGIIRFVGLAAVLACLYVFFKENSDALTNVF